VASIGGSFVGGRCEALALSLPIFFNSSCVSQTWSGATFAAGSESESNRSVGVVVDSDSPGNIPSIVRSQGRILKNYRRGKTWLLKIQCLIFMINSLPFGLSVYIYELGDESFPSNDGTRQHFEQHTSALLASLWETLPGIDQDRA